MSDTKNDFNQAKNALFSQQAVVAYYPGLAGVCGGVKAALMLSQLIYWSGRVTVRRRGGWLYKSVEELAAETGLSKAEQQTARRELMRRGLVEACLKGIPRTWHYRVNLERLVQVCAGLEDQRPETLPNEIQGEEDPSASGKESRPTEDGNSAQLNRNQRLQQRLPQEEGAGGAPASREEQGFSQVENPSPEAMSFARNANPRPGREGIPSQLTQALFGPALCPPVDIQPESACRVRPLWPPEGSSAIAAGGHKGRSLQESGIGADQRSGGHEPQTSGIGSDQRSGGNEPHTPDAQTPPSAPDPMDHPAIRLVRQVTGRWPQKAAYEQVIRTLGGSPDRERFARVYEAWCMRGYRPTNLEGQLDWYRDGIPGRAGQPKSAVKAPSLPPDERTQDERAATQARLLAARAEHQRAVIERHQQRGMAYA